MSTIHTDKNGFLVKEASYQNIQGKWKEAVDEITRSCKEHLGSRLISIYIGGSVAHGDAIENKSDIDSYIIIDSSVNGLSDDSWTKDEESRMNALFPFQRGIEIHLIPVDSISEGKKFQMKVFSAYVYGRDFSVELPEYKLDRETIGRVRVSIGNDIEKTKTRFAASSTEADTQKTSVWIAKRLIRSAGMICIWKENFFTMDVEKMLNVFTAHYPDKKIEIEKLFTYIKNPPSDKHVTLTLLESFGSWLIAEDARVFAN